MRIRATAAIAVVSGALALTAAVIPAAQATGKPSARQGWAAAHTIGSAARPATAGTFAAKAAKPDDAEPYPLAVKFSNVKVNSGKPGVSVGTTNTVHVPYTYTLTATDVDLTADDFWTGVDIYRGSPDENAANDLSGDNPPTCAITSSATNTSGSVVTVENCKGTIDIYPQEELTNDDPGAGWHSVAWAVAFNGQDPEDPDPSKMGSAELTGLAAPAVQRNSSLTVNAAPEPVRKGATVTITGKLSRANWDTSTYAGYVGQPVKLQFRKKSSSTYTTLKTIKTDSHGNLKTTYKSSVDGYWRYSFGGTSTTPAVSAAGDYVDVK